MLTIPDWDKSAAAAKGSSLAQFWRDPAMKPFAEKFERKLGELIGQADKDFAREWAEFKPLVGGQITLAVIRNEWQGEANTGPDFVALIDVKDKAKQLRDFLDKCEKTDADAGQTIQRETVRGVKFPRGREGRAQERRRRCEDEVPALHRSIWLAAAHQREPQVTGESPRAARRRGRGVG